IAHANRCARQSEETEGPFAVDEAGRNAHRQAAGGDYQAGDDRHFGELAPAGDELGAGGADVADGAGRAVVGEGDFEDGPGLFEGGGGTVSVDVEGGHWERG